MYRRQSHGSAAREIRLRGDPGRRLFAKWLHLRRRNSGGAPISNRLSLEIKRYGSNDKGIDGDSLWAYHAEAMRAAMGTVKPSLARFLARQPGHDRQAAETSP